MVDAFTLALLGTVLLASILPARGQIAASFDVVTDLGVALLFALHGAKLAREDIVRGIGHWRLHLLVGACTYLLFPLVAVLLKPVFLWALGRELALGFVFLATLPSTVQSSIAFTSVARGNVAAAVCAAALSNLLGVVLTPMLVALLLGNTGTVPLLGAVQKIGTLILLPFAIGHALRPWVGAWISAHKKWIGIVDRGAILLIVYSAFSESVVLGLWQKVAPSTLVWTLLASFLVLAIALCVSCLAARKLGFNKGDEIAIVFCGSKKSLASGLPMARVLFAGNPALGAILMPTMLFHQIQLMACAQLAERYARRRDDSGPHVPASR